MEQVAVDERPGREEDLARTATGRRTGPLGRRSNAIEDICFLRRELARITPDRFELLFQGFGNVDRERPRRRAGSLEEQPEIALMANDVDGQVVEHVVPFGQPRIEHRRVGDLHGLRVVR